MLDTLAAAKRLNQQTWKQSGLKDIAGIARRTYVRGVQATGHFLDQSPIQYDPMPQLNYFATPDSY